MEWGPLIAGGGSGITIWWLTQGVYGWWKTHQARKVELESDERKAETRQDEDELTRRRRAEARVRVLDDYAHRLRQQLRDCGVVPERWPPLVIFPD